MTLTLYVLAMVAALNPFRAASARGEQPTGSLIGPAIGATLLLVLLAAAVSGPFLDAIDVSGPNARIAAGIALLVVAAKDIFLAPPAATPALPGWKAGVIPLAFPVIFSPAAALLAITAASDRGVGIAVVGAVIALIPNAVALIATSDAPRRIWVSAIGCFSAGVAAFVVLDGVYAI
jgi:small neutral amino acid transporter SnatA (MarC family)